MKYTFLLSEKFSYGDTEIVAVGEKTFVFTVDHLGRIYGAKRVPFSERLTRPFVSYGWPLATPEEVAELADMPPIEGMGRLPLAPSWDFAEKGDSHPPRHITS